MNTFYRGQIVKVRSGAISTSPRHPADEGYHLFAVGDLVKVRGQANDGDDASFIVNGYTSNPASGHGGEYLTQELSADDLEAV
jgi:hypothetical protein